MRPIFKPPHAVDVFGYPLDPVLRELQGKLGNFAAEFRQVSRGLDKQQEIVDEYHAVMKKLYELGWDDILDIEAELPERFLPKEYVRRHPPLNNASIRPLK